MINKALLDEAKAFLCWDVFPNLSIQLVEFNGPVSYYYPPSERNTIILHYERGNPNFSFPLFLLFHEAGHLLQFKEMQTNGTESDFWKIINVPTGLSKTKFEKEGWSKGRVVFQQFIRKHRLEEALLKDYDRVAQNSIESYD